MLRKLQPESQILFSPTSRQMYQGRLIRGLSFQPEIAAVGLIRYCCKLLHQTETEIEFLEGGSTITADSRDPIPFSII